MVSEMSRYHPKNEIWSDFYDRTLKRPTKVSDVSTNRIYRTNKFSKYIKDANGQLYILVSDRTIATFGTIAGGRATGTE